MIDSSKYVVLDVETNGLSSLECDLLSISIYKPDDKKTLERFLPLELDYDVYTTHINGITKKMLKNKTPLTQEEFDNIIDKFDLENRIILHYGHIDQKFIKNYLKRKKISGYEKLNFYNFKHDIISSRFSEGNVTKDNLCRIYGIDNVTEIHNGLNDCILEWKLFEKMNGKKLIIIRDTVNEFNKDYYIPASYLQTYSNFKYVIDYPKIKYNMVPIKSINITSKKLKKFDTNISGMVIEHLINTMLEVEDVNDKTKDFQIENRNKLKYIGTLPSRYSTLTAIFNNDGTITAVNKKDEKKVEEINDVTLEIKKEIVPLIEYIKRDIFKNKKIMSQELIINEKDRVIAKCDLSSEDTILEIKMYNARIDDLKYQLYYESNNREIYILQSFWYFKLKEGLKFTIYKVM